MEAGGLISYGLSYHDYYKGVARYVDKVLRGTKPDDHPVKQIEDRAGDKFEDGESRGPHDPRLSARASGRGDPVMDRRTFVGIVAGSLSWLPRVPPSHSGPAGPIELVFWYLAVNRGGNLRQHRASVASEGGNLPVAAHFVLAENVQVAVIGIDPEPALRWREPAIDHGRTASRRSLSRNASGSCSPRYPA